MSFALAVLTSHALTLYAKGHYGVLGILAIRVYPRAFLSSLMRHDCVYLEKLTLKDNIMKDYYAALAIGLALAIGALHYFDVLVK